MSRTLRLRTGEAFAPLLKPARYKGAWGGRGSGKSHFFAEMGIEDALRFPGDHGEGLRFLAVREVQKTLKESAKRLFEDKIEKFGLTERDGFKVYKEAIELPGDGIITFTGMQDHTADSVKSYEGYHRAWGEEAQSLSDRSITLLRPTIRADLSELWFTWNPNRPTDPIDRLLRSDDRPTGAVVVRANWDSNPWFPKVLEQERRDCLEKTPDRYGHIWEGEYATVLEGAYFAQHLTNARLEGRIGFMAYDPLMKRYAFWDIAGTGDKADAVAIWIMQFIGDEVRVLDYYEAVGQPFEAHVNWLRANGHENANMVLPHDGVKHDTVFSATPEGYLRKAGFSVDVISNQGRGAAMHRIEAARQMLPRCRFHEERTDPGRQALGWYHEKRDEARNVGLGPHHDWSSHGADAFGLAAIWDKSRPRDGQWRNPIRRNLKGVA